MIAPSAAVNLPPTKKAAVKAGAQIASAAAAGRVSSVAISTALPCNRCASAASPEWIWRDSIGRIAVPSAMPTMPSGIWFSRSASFSSVSDPCGSDGGEEGVDELADLVDAGAEGRGQDQHAQPPHLGRETRQAPLELQPGPPHRPDEIGELCDPREADRDRQRHRDDPVVMPLSPRSHQPVRMPPISTMLSSTGAKAPGAKRERALSRPDSIATRLISTR